MQLIATHRNSSNLSEQTHPPRCTVQLVALKLMDVNGTYGMSVSPFSTNLLHSMRISAGVEGEKGWVSLLIICSLSSFGSCHCTGSYPPARLNLGAGDHLQRLHHLSDQH